MNEATVRRMLESERARLEEVRGSLSLDSLKEPQLQSSQELSSVDQHLADLGTETFEREKAESIRVSTESQLQDVDRALARLASGDYGICEICGRKISDARLKARPATRYCVEDQARVEGEAAGLV